MEWIWTAQELDRIRLYRFLTQHKSILLSELMQELDLSKYKILSMVEQLSTDAEAITGVNGIVKISDTNTVSYQAPLNTLSIDELKQYYLSKSVRGQIIEHLFNEDMTSWEELAFDLGISTPKIFKERAIIQANLMDQGIEISRDYKLVGREENIRLFKFAMLTIYNGQRINSLPDNISRLVDTYIDWIIVSEFGPIRESSVSVIRHLAAMMLVRLSNRHFVSNECTDYLLKPTHLLTSQSQHIVEKLMDLLNKDEDIEEDVRHSEARFVVLLLHGLGVFSNEQSDLDLSEKVIGWQTRFNDSIKYVYTHMFLGDISDKDVKRLNQSWSKQLLRFMIYPFTEGNSSGMHDDVNYENLQINYPLGFELSSKILDHFSQSTGVDTVAIKGALLNEMVAGFVIDGSVYKNVPKANILVDFGINQNLERLFAERFDKVTAAKINITHTFDDTIDIVVVDVPYKQQNTESVFVWEGAEPVENIRQLFEAINRVWIHKFNLWRHEKSV